MTDEQIALLKANRLNPDNWEVVHEDKRTLEVLNRRKRRRVLKKCRKKSAKKKRGAGKV